MTETEITERIALLETARAKALANVNALNGAIEDCEFWLGRIRSPAIENNGHAPLNRIADEAPARSN